MGGTVAASGPIKFSDLRSIFVVTASSFADYGINANEPISLSQLKNVVSEGVAYARGEQNPINTSISALYPNRGTKEVSVGAMRNKSIPNKTVTIRLRGNAGTETVILEVYSRSGAVIGSRNFTATTTMTTYTVATVTASGSAAEPSYMLVNFTNDGAGRDVIVESVAYNGVEAMWPTRFEDKSSYYAANDASRRFGLVSGGFGWGGIYRLYFAKVGNYVAAPGVI